MQMYALKLEGLMSLKVANRYTQTDGWVHDGQKMCYHILVCVEEGECVFKIEDRQIPLAQNECILVPANTFYAPRAIGTCVFKAFHFSAETENLGDMRKPQSPLPPNDIPTLTVPEKFKTDSAISMYLDNALEEARKRTNESLIRKNVHFINALVRISENAKQIGISTLAQKIKNYIDTHLESDINIFEIAKEFGYSKQHIIRIFKENFHQTPSKYILETRLEMSLTFLSESYLTVSEIAQRCGFKDLNYFSRQFKKNYTLSPSAYRKKLRERI